jgi:hypothetical protein
MSQQALGDVAIVLLGDVMLGRIVDRSLTALPGQAIKIWGNTLPLLQGDMAEPGKEEQVNICNLETSVTTAESAVPKTFNFRMRPENLEALK